MKIYKTSKIAILFTITLTLNSPISATILNKETIENSKDLKELISFYRNNFNNAFLSDDDLVNMAREDWHEFSKKEAEKAMCFDTLPPQIVITNGVTYRLYGFTHGSKTIPMPKKYGDFVRKSYQLENDRITHSQQTNDASFRSGFLIGEQHASHILNDKDAYFVDMKDILHTKPQFSSIANFIAGYVTSFFIMFPKSEPAPPFPLHMLEKAFSIQEDSMPIDVKEGLEKKLPSHLETQVVLSKIYHEGKLYQKSLPMETIRSLYMAGFLKSFAESANYKEIPCFMGSYHLPEVKGFLLDANGYAEKTEAYLMGKEKGALLAKNLLIAQENGDQAIVDTLAVWNPIIPETQLALFLSMGIPTFLGVCSGVITQAWLIYRFADACVSYFVLTIPDELLREFHACSPETQAKILNELSPRNREILFTHLSKTS